MFIRMRFTRREPQFDSVKFALRTSKGITFVCLLSYSVVKEPTSAERAAILAEPSRPCQAECFQALAAHEPPFRLTRTRLPCCCWIEKIEQPEDPRILPAARRAVNFVPGTSVTACHPRLFHAC